MSLTAGVVGGKATAESQTNVILDTGSKINVQATITHSLEFPEEGASNRRTVFTALAHAVLLISRK